MNKIYHPKKTGNRTNYYQKSILTIEQIRHDYPDRKPKLLLHACCAPCACWPLEFLSSVFDVTVFFNNSNIYPASEYDRRLDELKRYLTEVWPDIHLFTVPYDNESYTKKLEPMKDDIEASGRCFYCYALRMKEAYQYADDQHYDFFTTVMTISRQKDSQKLNEIGKALAVQHPSVPYFYSDFKKAGGQVRAQQLSDEHHLYRQDYCGCIYSLNNSHSEHN